MKVHQGVLNHLLIDMHAATRIIRSLTKSKLFPRAAFSLGPWNYQKEKQGEHVKMQKYYYKKAHTFDFAVFFVILHLHLHLELCLLYRA